MPSSLCISYEAKWKKLKQSKPPRFIFGFRKVMKWLWSKFLKKLQAIVCHLLSLSSHFNAIDGSVHGQVTEDYYCRHHKMGAFANASTETARRNCEYVHLEIPARFAYAQPYDWEESTKSYPSTNYEKRIFLRTTKFVSAGTEFLTDYQRGYYERHDIVWSKTIVFNGKIKQISTHENLRVTHEKCFMSTSNIQ